jgi:hypothetical protein
MVEGVCDTAVPIITKLFCNDRACNIAKRYSCAACLLAGTTSLEVWRMSLRQCSHCQRFFTPNPRTAAFQKACSSASCRHARKQRADYRRRDKNPGYDKSRRPKRLQWATNNPTYYRNYRASRPVYTERNRRQTRERVKRVRRMFANQDAIARSIDGVVLCLLHRACLQTQTL